MGIQTTKNMGALGAVLIFVSPLLFLLNAFGKISWSLSAFSLVVASFGCILILMALKGFAAFYKESKIFDNAIYGVSLGVMGGVTSAVLTYIAFVKLLKIAGIPTADFTNFGTFPQVTLQSITSFEVPELIVALIVGYASLMAFVIGTAFLLRKSLNILSTKPYAGLFKFVGLIAMVGALFTPVFIGVFLLWFSLLLLAVAFFSIKEVGVLEEQK